jgi:glycosyltransferase involved in cell wall biosynthesis
MKPLVTIIIPAYNAEETLAYAIQSAVAQTWPYKQIIIVNDGSTDSTEAIARRFESAGVTVVSKKNGGLSHAINHVMPLAQGEYIQELDSDDILAPDKIERQLEVLRPGDSKRILLSSAWAPFHYRTRTARFLYNSLCEDLSPADWLVRKLSGNLYTQNATWLVSRELAEAAGPWDADLHYDQDGEYFARVLIASVGTRFVPGTGVYYRANTTKNVSYIGRSNTKKESLFRSMKLHIGYLQSVEQSERVRAACLTYLQNWYLAFCPERPDIVAELQSMAAALGGELNGPHLRRKFAWMRPVVGLETAKWAQMALPQVRSYLVRRYDKTMFGLEAMGAPMVQRLATTPTKRG